MHILKSTFFLLTTACTEGAIRYIYIEIKIVSEDVTGAYFYRGVLAVICSEGSTVSPFNKKKLNPWHYSPEEPRPTEAVAAR